jgi:ferredoxin
VQVVQGLLEILGIGKDRLDFACVHPSEISKLVETVNGFNEQITKLGPSVFLQSDDQAKFHWMTEFKKCDDCHQCKEVCPICFCKKCYSESFQNFGIGWLVHVVERCTVCGACKDTCPRGIHLFEIIQLFQEKISKLDPLSFLNVSSIQEGRKGEVITSPPPSPPPSRGRV